MGEIVAAFGVCHPHVLTRPPDENKEQQELSIGAMRQSGKLIAANFDISYSEDALLGHTFALPFESVIEKRNIPVIPFFTNGIACDLPCRS